MATVTPAKNDDDDVKTPQKKSGKVDLVQVGCRRYMRQDLGGYAIGYMETVSVDEDLADTLEEITWIDRGGNTMPMFVPPDDPKVKAYRENMAAAANAVAKSRRRRSAK